LKHKKIKRYYQLFRRAFDIFYNELAHINIKKSILQMAVKAVNDTAGPDGLVPILLVFEAYPRISHNSSSSPIITKRAKAIRKAMAEVRKLIIFR
jgi:hypothetical protein